LNFYHKPSGRSEVEMIDIKNRRLFLRKTPFDGVRLEDLFVGAKVNVMGRQLTVIDYEDGVTRDALAKSAARCFAMLGAEAVDDAGMIWERINAGGLRVADLVMANLSTADASAVFGSGSLAGRVVAMELIGADAVATWHRIMEELRMTKYRAEFTGLVGAETEAAADKYLAAFFGGDSRVDSVVRGTATLSDCTCAIIKPHAIAEGRGGPLLSALWRVDGLRVTAARMFDIDLRTAEEFLEVYKGVVPEYLPLATELSCGKFLVLELSGADAVMRLREAAGPHDVDTAKRVRPHTLRAQFGTDSVKNAVHATDLTEDGTLECEYFFSLLL
jgi:nucleoside-diphosphate kinase